MMQPAESVSIDDATFSLSFYKNKNDNMPEQRTVRWSDLVASLRFVRRCACTGTSCDHNKCPYKNGQSWSPASYRDEPCNCLPPVDEDEEDLCPHKRRDANVVNVSLLVADVDHVDTDTISAIHGRLGRLVGHIIHASHSDQPADRCVRIVMPLSRPVPGHQWRRFWAAAMHELGLKAPSDPKCKNPSRFYYSPSRPKDVDYFFVEAKGPSLDVDDVLARAPEEEPPARPKPRPQTKPRGASVFDVLETLDQGEVLLEVSGTALVAGQTIELGKPNRRGNRAIIINGKSTGGFVDSNGTIGGHGSTGTSSLGPDGGPYVSTWLRHPDYGHASDVDIRRGLIEHVDALRSFAREARSHQTSSRIGGQEEHSEEQRADERADPSEPSDRNQPPVGDAPPEDDIPPPGDDDAPRGGRKPKAKGAVELAARFIEEHAMHEDGPTLRRWRGEWYRWFGDRGCYRTASAERVDADLYRSLGLKSRADVGDVRHALIAVDNVLIDEVDLGAWIDPVYAGDPMNLAVCKNGLLDLATGVLTPATPAFFGTSCLGTKYDAAAPKPKQWIAFLEQLWPNDPQSIEALQEWFGYMLTSDTRQQKILLLIGGSRSGKGTIMRVKTAMLGQDGIAAPTLSQLGTNFGLWPLIGKSAAIIGDARLGGRSDIAQIVERLLSISGCDPMTIDRKNLAPWNGTLSTRIAIVSNELPVFSDASDAIVSRMLLLESRGSWLGCEDTNLTSKLLTELPGILLWAIEGWGRLRERGHFVQPASGESALNDMSNLASPIGQWVRERCLKGPHSFVQCTEAWNDYCDWCERQKQRAPTQAMFGRNLKAAVRGCERLKHRIGTSLEWVYFGLELMPRFAGANRGTESRYAPS